MLGGQWPLTTAGHAMAGVSGQGGNISDARQVLDWLDAMPRIIGVTRERLGLSLRATARQAGVSASTLMRFEVGRPIQLGQLLRLLTWLAEQDDPALFPLGLALGVRR